MGGCFSSGSVKSLSDSSALVISPAGELRPYSTPVLVSHVLQQDSSSFFVCNSDSLCYEEHIKALDAEDELEAGQIYFLLPISKLRHPLTASEMAALAVKASVALNTTTSSTSKGDSRRNRKSKISPFVVMENSSSSSKVNVIVNEELAQKQRGSSLGVSPSGSIRKIQRYSSRKIARLAARSFKLRLSTIYETQSSDANIFFNENSPVVAV